MKTLWSSPFFDHDFFWLKCSIRHISWTIISLGQPVNHRPYLLLSRIIILVSHLSLCFYMSLIFYLVISLSCFFSLSLSKAYFFQIFFSNFLPEARFSDYFFRLVKFLKYSFAVLSTSFWSYWGLASKILDIVEESNFY